VIISKKNLSTKQIKNSKKKKGTILSNLMDRVKNIVRDETLQLSLNQWRVKINGLGSG
jgi:hypothetical protein